MFPLNKSRLSFPSLADELRGPSNPSRRGWNLPLEVRETGDAFRVLAELPGVSRESLAVTFEEGVLTIEAEKVREELAEGEKSHIVERRFGKLGRSLTLGAHIDEAGIEARYHDGLLTLTIPKAQPARKTIEIKIEG